MTTDGRHSGDRWEVPQPTPDPVVLWLCRTCGSWQKYAGPCDNGCGHLTVKREYRPAAPEPDAPYGGSE